jgi:hypothetical protein
VELRAAPRQGRDYFRVSGGAGHITVEGTSPAVLLTGFGWYLKNVAKAGVSWNGEQLRLPHTPTTTTDTSRRKRRFLPGPKAEVSTPRMR